METPDLRYTDSPLTASNTRIEKRGNGNVYVSNVDLEIEVGSGIGEAYPV
eukprot:CAMPEP_0171317446 /NCGR_PEP_ID=MMETSP0816-20121228/80709_1 /TAXON_ID=420281 /ORGANISM="Proboscia inermis, Strain CCAP1064/1" /LENGTH=49 /DNA_ID= /DNA_START= /DNA_END= /DNA_ORIENTATION=